ncbi:hypothetical protein HOLleu_34914 [Holothuria leucospilota]|uniref:Peptidase aspartic putative domain-containing protein n=1 Tax=Holothuria leucospilota TaxID=206669 RepID=A0A9Q0YLX8_HOLLE|nr:hypothetical protein HOLleu_34914 [Holothuria leucospilota]
MAEMQIENEIANAEVEVKVLEEEGFSVGSGSGKGLKIGNRGNVPDYGATKIKVSAPDAPEGTGVGKRRSTSLQVPSVNKPQELYKAISTAVNMPKLEMITFSGDPSEFWGFMNNHEASVASKTIDRRPNLRISYRIVRAKKASEMISSGEDPKFLHMTEFVERAAKAANSMYGSNIGKAEEEQRKNSKGNSGVRKASVFATSRDTSLCERGLVEEVGLVGESKAFSVKTVTGKGNALGFEVSLLVPDMEGREHIEIPRVLAVDKLPISSENMPTQEDLSKWPHLNDVDIPVTNLKEVKLLIGCDTPEAFWVVEQRKGRRKEPYAVRTLLGWTLVGPTGKRQTNLNAFTVNHICQTCTDDQLQKQIKRFGELDHSFTKGEETV